LEPGVGLKGKRTSGTMEAATDRDNEQAVRLQGKKGPISKCTVCHLEDPDDEFWHFRKAE